MMTLSDEELVARCKAELPGNTRSYEVLVERHMNRVYSVVYRVVGNKEEAEDVTQEVFVKVYNNLSKFEQQASFSSWLYRIATNCALDAIDKIKRRPTNSESALLDSLSTAGPEESVIRAELRDCINKVLKKLGHEQAHVLILRDFEDLSYDEIAEALTASLSAVKMRIHRARLAFQEVFSKMCGAANLAISLSSQNNTKGKVKEA
jgi:RNA polymerase sigma-70 factor, ECF subfamily